MSNKPKSQIENLTKSVETLQTQLETVSGYVTTGQQNMVIGVQSADGNLQNYINENNENTEKISSKPGESLNLKDSELPEQDEVKKVDGSLYINNGGNLKQVLNLPYTKPSYSFEDKLQRRWWWLSSDSSGDAEKQIGTRTQLAFVIDHYQFSGLSLFDGDSNDNITGASTIPPLAPLNANRGTPLSGKSMSLPFNIVGPGVGSSATGYATPSNNNYNKTYNPTLTAKSDGLPIRYNPVDPLTPDTSIEAKNIINNMSKLKGSAWDALAQSGGTTGVVNPEVIDILQTNYGSGLEIEAYLFPSSYDKNKSPWANANENANENDQFIFGIGKDITTIQFTTDAQDYDSWYALYESWHNEPGKNNPNLETIIKNFVNTATDNGNSEVALGNGWCSFGGSSPIIFTIQLLTNVMLPSLMETSSTNVAKEFATYVTDGAYTMNDVKLYNLGTVTINSDGTINSSSILEPSNTDYPFQTPSTTPPMFIRGNDGQGPVSVKTLGDYMSAHIDPKDPTSILNIVNSNPFSGYLPNMGPSCSAALLTEHIKYPIVWYNSAWVDPFTSTN